MPRQIQGSQTDFSFGEVDVAIKRADGHPARKGGLRQMANSRILNTGGLQNRPGRRALYPVTNGGKRTERFTIAAGSVFDIQFAAGRVKIIDSTGTTVGNFTTKGSGGALPWASQADINSIVYAVSPFSKDIYITFGHSMRPQVISWDGVATWSIADFTEQVIGSQKRTAFYRISPQDITLQPFAQTGAGVNLIASSALFTAAWVGTRLRYIGRQMLVTAFTNSTHVTVTIEESLPASQTINFGGTDPRLSYAIGDEVIGSVSGSKGIVISFALNNIVVQLLSAQASTGSAAAFQDKGDKSSATTVAFVAGETIAGPGGSLPATAISAVGNPLPVTIWDDEVMNDLRGYPASCFVDQFRVGFCDYPAVPGGIGWSAINTPTDLYVGPNPADAMFEIAPRKVQIYHVVPGPEGAEFVFCDRAIFYIPISETNPLRPGSVAFKLLSGDGAAQVRPRLAQEAILYANAGQSSMMAVIATGAYLRPFNTKNLSDYHFHLFDGIAAIAAPSADGTFNERYVYVMNADGSVVCGKYDSASLTSNAPVIGWGPWSGGGTVSWVSARAADVLFTSTYFGNGVVEILDDTEYLDCALAVNSLPAAFTPPGGKGPLWFVAAGQTVSLIDQGTRYMGTYVVDANGFIIAQNNGGEDLTRLDLIAGQPWTMTTEPFAPIAQSGVDVHQRMNMRQFAYFAAYVINSTGFLIQQLFSAKQTATSPALGTAMAERRFPMWNTGDDATKPPTQRETVESWAPPGSSFDPRAAIVKDQPGPLLIAEIAIEVSI